MFFVLTAKNRIWSQKGTSPAFLSTLRLGSKSNYGVEFQCPRVQSNHGLDQREEIRGKYKDNCLSSFFWLQSWAKGVGELPFAKPPGVLQTFHKCLFVSGRHCKKPTDKLRQNDMVPLRSLSIATQVPKGWGKARAGGPWDKLDEHQ